MKERSMLILAAPCTGKTYLVKKYPGVFVDVDSVCGDIYRQLDTTFGKEWWLLKDDKWRRVRDDLFKEFSFPVTRKIYLSAERILNENDTLSLQGVFFIDEEEHIRRCQKRFLEDKHSPKWDHIKPGVSKYLALVPEGRRFNITDESVIDVHYKTDGSVEYVNIGHSR